MTPYSHPETLVSTDWVKQNLNTPGVRIVEIDVDTKAYDAGHVPGAVGFNWETQLQDQVSRDILGKEGFQQLLSAAGIRNDDHVVLYGDNNNWFAAYGFWLFKMYGHENVSLMNGGRNKWLNEDDKALTPDPSPVQRSEYRIVKVDHELRAKVPDVLAIAQARSANLVDVRSPDEFSGKVIAPPGMTETAQRGGHVPGAKSIPWSRTVNADGTFKSVDDLRQIYFKDAGLKENTPTVCYCRIGERSSHSWFVLKYLLGVKDCKNYDGSWTEYGSMVGVPIEK